MSYINSFSPAFKTIPSVSCFSCIFHYNILFRSNCFPIFFSMKKAIHILDIFFEVKRLYSSDSQFFYHAIEYITVKWQDGIPIKSSCNSFRTKSGSLFKQIIFNFEFKPCFTRQFHFGIEK